MPRDPRYYDLVLVVIMTSVLCGLLVGYATTVSMSTAVSLASLLATVAIGHALFVNGPVDALEDLGDPVDPEKVPGLPSALE